MAKIKKDDKIKSWQCCRPIESFDIIDRSVKLYNYLDKGQPVSCKARYLMSHQFHTSLYLTEMEHMYAKIHAQECS